MQWFVVFGLFGWCAEIVWTGFCEAVTGLRPATHDPTVLARIPRAERLRLTGRTYLWMFPIYGTAGLLFVHVHHWLSAWPWPTRGAVYMIGAFAIEALTGWILRRVTQRCPWDYSYARASALGGLIRLDYAVPWFLFGLILEQVQALVVGWRVA